jgi:Protein of unknown function (DUF2786)
MSQELDKIKVRIAKLLRMSQDSSSPEEAAIAAGRARALMDKHQLDAMDIGENKEEFGTATGTPFLKDIPNYMSTLAVAVAKYNDCQAKYEFGQHAVRSHERGQAVLFMGYVSDVNMAVEMFKRLTNAINRLCKEYLKEQGYAEYNPALGGQFKTGASIAIISKLNQMTRERDALTSSGGTSLVVCKTKAVNERFGVVKYSSVKERRLTREEQDAREVGHVRGTRVEVNHSVR